MPSTLPKLPAVTLPSLGGFAIAAGAGGLGEWSLDGYCWSAWLAGLVFAWTAIAAVVLRVALGARAVQVAVGTQIPALGRLSPALFTAVAALMAVAGGAIAAYAVTLLFGAYGIMLSFFAEMEPHALFGRNGFINSDFFTPVGWLAEQYWPMVAGTLLANSNALLAPPNWQQPLAPLSTEIVRMHMLIVVMPFIALAAWALFGPAWEPVAVLTLTAIFYFAPGHGRQPSEGTERSPI